jgi:hypothetical protein
VEFTPEKEVEVESSGKVEFTLKKNSRLKVPERWNSP